MTENTADNHHYLLDERYGIAALIVTVLITAFSTLVGPIAVLAFYGLWLPLLLLPLLKQKKFVLFPLHRHLLPLFFGVYCIYSVFWSDYLSTTLYAATQYFTTILIAIIIAKLVSLENFLKGLCWGCLAIFALYYALSATGATGLFGSKNMIGYYAQIGFLTAMILCVFNDGSFRKKLLPFIIPVLFFLYILVSSKSATSLLSTLIIAGLFTAAIVVGKFSKGLRAVSAVLGVLFVLSLSMIMIFLEFDAYGYVLELFGKSKSLTGRTDIWQTGLDVSQNSPFLGTGYAAFWVGGQMYAEQLWDQFDIPNKSGFHFHNVFIQAYVELGVLGLSALILMVINSVVRSLTLFIKQGLNMHIALFLICSVLFLARGFAEVDMFFPYTIGTLLFFVVYTKIIAYRSIG